MPERQDEFRIPDHETNEFFQDVPRIREGRSSLDEAQARWGVADIFVNNKPEQQELPQRKLALRTQGVVDRRQHRLDSVIALHEDGQEPKQITRLVTTVFGLLTGVKKPFSTLAKGVTERELIQLESEIGSQLFSKVPAGHRREFFCLDKDTWIWHEESIDIETGKLVVLTTRYEIHENGVLKDQEGARYNFLEGQELDDLLFVTQRYDERVAAEIYEPTSPSYKIAA